MLRLPLALAGLSFVSALALAQVPSYITVIDGSTSPWEIPLIEAKFVFYEQVISIEEGKPELALGKKLLADSLNISDPKVTSNLYTKILQIIDAVRAFRIRVSQQLCNSRHEIKTPDDLALAYERVDKEMEVERESLDRQPQYALGSDIEAKLNDFILNRYRKQLRGHRVDYSKWMTTIGETPEQILARRCNSNP